MAKKLTAPGAPMFVFGGFNLGIQTNGVNLGSSVATKLTGSTNVAVLPERQSVLIVNQNANPIYVGGSNVSAASIAPGIPVFTSTSTAPTMMNGLWLPAGPDVQLWGYSAAGTGGTSDVTVIQFA